MPGTTPIRRPSRAHAILLALLAASATASPARAQDAATVAGGTCRQLSPSVFVIDGGIDKAMRACVAATLGAGTTEVIVSSGGGDIEAALDIADLLARPGLTVRVREWCYSSCANYFLPLAARLVVEPGATIVLHGGIDPQYLREGHIGRRSQLLRDRMKLRPDLSRAVVEAEFGASITSLQALVERQKQFALKHGVGLGWFLYREPGDREFGRFLSGEAGSSPGVFGWRYLLAEEPLLRSCLPGVALDSYQADLEASFIGNAERFAKFRKAKGRRSLQLRCSPPTPGDAAMPAGLSAPRPAGG